MGKKANLDKIREEICEAHKLVWAAYLKFRANNEIPAWIILNSTTAESRITSGVWSVTSYLFKMHELPPGMSWERKKDGSNELVSRDLETGERQIIISYDVEDSLIVHTFDAEVDLSSRTVTLKHVVAAEQLRPEDFMLEFDNFDLTKMWDFGLTPEQNKRNVFGPGKAAPTIPALNMFVP